MPKVTVRIYARRTDKEPLDVGMIQLKRDRFEDLTETSVIQHLRNNRDKYGYYIDKDAGMAYFGAHEIALSQYEGLSVEIVSISKAHDLQRQELERVKDVDVGDTVELGQTPAHPLEPDQKHVRIGEMIFERPDTGSTTWTRRT